MHHRQFFAVAWESPWHDSEPWLFRWSGLMVCRDTVSRAQPCEAPHTILRRPRHWQRRATLADHGSRYGNNAGHVSQRVPSFSYLVFFVPCDPPFIAVANACSLRSLLFLALSWRGSSALVQTAVPKGVVICGGDFPKACQVSSLACNARCISCLGLVVIMENLSGRRCGVITTTLLAHPEIW